MLSRALIITLSTSLLGGLAWGQGCVAVRNMSCSAADPSAGLNNWRLGLGYRFYESYKHFVGDEEQAERVEQGTEVINDVNSLEASLSHSLTRRLSASLIVPVNFFSRSSLYEHYGNAVAGNPGHERFSTGVAGIGDMRVSASYWTRNPAASPRWNLATGLGLKLPTGNSEAYDNFHRRVPAGVDASNNPVYRDSTFRRPVDQSIQPGDGGWGIDLQLQGFVALFRRSSLYFDGYYLVTPQETNNTLTRGVRGGDALTEYLSVADQFGARMGVAVALPQGFHASLGGRAEGVPAYDAIGGEAGFRRPGYIISLEPAVNYGYRQFGFSFGLPVAVYRNRIKSYADDKRGRHGDAAFADLMVLAGMSYNFSLVPKASHPGMI